MMSMSVLVETDGYDTRERAYEAMAVWVGSAGAIPNQYSPTGNEFNPAYLERSSLRDLLRRLSNLLRNGLSD